MKNESVSMHGFALLWMIISACIDDRVCYKKKMYQTNIQKWTQVIISSLYEIILC